jgi:uncharacterized protein (TIGR02118 family)
MFRFIALYANPTDPDGFEAHYRSTHIPIMERWPGVKDTTITRVTGTPRGGDAPYHLLTTVTFDSRDDFMSAMGTDAGKESAQDARGMVEQFGVEVTMLLGDDFG